MYFPKRTFFIPVLLLSVFLLFSGCVKNNSFISSKKLKDKILGTWKLQRLLNQDIDETWVFSNNGSIIRQTPLGTTMDAGTFTVNARLYGSKMGISGMMDDIYNGKWYIVNLNNRVLQINIDFKCPEGIKQCGTFERELYRE